MNPLLQGQKEKYYNVERYHRMPFLIIIYFQQLMHMISKVLQNILLKKISRRFRVAHREGTDT